MRKVLWLLMLFSSISAVRVFAETTVINGYTWTYKIFDFYGCTVGLTSVYPLTGDIVVPAQIGSSRTYLGEMSLFDSPDITSITIPYGVGLACDGFTFGCVNVTNITYAEKFDVGLGTFWKPSFL